MVGARSAVRPAQPTDTYYIGATRACRGGLSKGASLSNTLAVYEFLLDDLKDDLGDHFSGENNTQAIFEFLYLIAAIGDEIPEAMLKIYAAPLGFDDEHLSRGISYLNGMGVLKVECSCSLIQVEYESSDLDDLLSLNVIDYRIENPCLIVNNGEWYEKGFNEKRLKSSTWLEVQKKIDTLKSDLETI